MRSDHPLYHKLAGEETVVRASWVSIEPPKKSSACRDDPKGIGKVLLVRNSQLAASSNTAKALWKNFWQAHSFGIPEISWNLHLDAWKKMLPLTKTWKFTIKFQRPWNPWFFTQGFEENGRKWTLEVVKNGLLKCYSGFFRSTHIFVGMKNPRHFEGILWEVHLLNILGLMLFEDPILYQLRSKPCKIIGAVVASDWWFAILLTYLPSVDPFC